MYSSWCVCGMGQHANSNWGWAFDDKNMVLHIFRKADIRCFCSAAVDGGCSVTSALFAFAGCCEYPFSCVEVGMWTGCEEARRRKDTPYFSWWRRKCSRFARQQRQIQFPIDSTSYYVWFMDRQTFASAQTDSQMYDNHVALFQMDFTHTELYTLEQSCSHSWLGMSFFGKPLSTRVRPINYTQQQQ